VRSLAALALSLALTGAATAADRGVSDAALAQAARDARLDQIDDARRQCQDRRRVEDWLKAVVGASARSIRWQGGACTLVIPQNPMDQGSAWCGGAEIAPKFGDEPVVIEVFFEKPSAGKPGIPFAFRAGMVTKDGPDYVRDTFSFENGWRELHGSSPPPARRDCD
jgi:hypothetical protein